MRRFSPGAITAAVAVGASAPCACADLFGIQEPLLQVDDAPLEASGPDVAPSGDAAGAPLVDASDALADEPSAPDLDAPGAPEAGPSGYVMSTPPAPTFVDACSLPGSFTVLANHNDSNTSPATLPVPFRFFGAPESLYWVNSNGVMGFDGLPSNLARAVCPLPNTLADPFPAIYAFGDDLYTRAGGVCVAVGGAAPNRQFIVTWSDAMFAGTRAGHLTFSVVLTETTNTIDLLYGTMTSGAEAQGLQATIGMEDSSGASVAQFSCDSASITATPLDVRFTPEP